MPITRQEAMLEGVYAKIARIISGRYDVRVMIAGSEIFVDLETRTIHLPSFSDESVQGLEDFFDGFLDHETAHVLFSSAEALRGMTHGDPLAIVCNVLEDPRVEREMGRRYIGCQHNLHVMHEAFWARLQQKWEKQGVFQRTMLALLRCCSGQAEVGDFANDPLMGALFQTLRSEVEEGRQLRSTMEARELARRVLDKLKGLANKSGLVPELVQQQAQALQAELAQARDSEEGRRLIRVLDVEGLANEMISRRPRGHRGEPPDYIVFSEAWDYDTTYSLTERVKQSYQYEQIKAVSGRYIGTMAAQLELALAAETQTRTVPAERFGRRFDKRRLVSWLMGSPDDRIFRRLDYGAELDTAVSLLWDCSGSMGTSEQPGNKADVARIAAIAFHEALVRVGVPHEVLGFNTGGKCPEGLQQAVSKARASGMNLKPFSRLDEVDARMVFVPFGEVDGRAICYITGNHANRDGECVLWAAKRLAARSEARKVLIVGSDGLPSGARYHELEATYLKQVVQKVIRAGIEVYAIGIQDDSVSEYYPIWHVIEQADELPGAVMSYLSRSLLSQLGAQGTVHAAKGAAP